MTEEQLQNLLTEASNLSPSDQLRTCIADLPTKRRQMRWFALSGATATVAAVALLAIPKNVDAASLIERAEARFQSVASLQCQNLFNDGGKWQVKTESFATDGWELTRNSMGKTITLKCPTGFYRPGPNDKLVFSRNPKANWPTDNPNPEIQLHQFQVRRPGSILQIGRTFRDQNQVQREVVISAPKLDSRLIVTIEDASGLPRSILKEKMISGRWQPEWRSEYTYPKLSESDPVFVNALSRRVILDQDTIASRWTNRISQIRQTIDDGKGHVLHIRDARTLPNGHVLILYTGTPKLLARLVADDGTTYIRCPFIPNAYNDRLFWIGPGIPSSGGELLGLWFAPEKKGAVAKGAVHLELLDRFDQKTNSHLVQTIPESSQIPEWAYALSSTALSFGSEAMEKTADYSRIFAAYDRRLSDSNRSIPGPYSFDPDFTELGKQGFGERRDPKGALLAANLYKAWVKEQKGSSVQMGLRLDPTAERYWLNRFERAAKKQTP